MRARKKRIDYPMRMENREAAERGCRRSVVYLASNRRNIASSPDESDDGSNTNDGDTRRVRTNTTPSQVYKLGVHHFSQTANGYHKSIQHGKDGRAG